MATTMMYLVLLVTLYSSSDATIFYTRWGRTTCPSGASIIYTGYAAGAHYTHPGSGSNYICLPDRPEWGNLVAGRQGSISAFVYGTEYEFNTGFTNNAPFSYANNGGANLQNQNAPCVVCSRSGKSAVLTVPGKMNCPTPELTLEYQGYLAASYWNHVGKSEFVCLDATPEAIPGSAANNNGALFYPTQVSCLESTLVCPPYVDGNELSCVVCSL
jgi:hypothetical protein